MGLFVPNVDKLTAKGDVAGLLAASINSTDSRVCAQATSALLEVGPSSIGALRAALKDPNRRVRDRAVEILVRIGGPIPP